MRPHLLLLAAAGVLTATSGMAGANGGRTAPMPFSECEAIIAEVASDVGVEPVVLASSAGVLTVRIDAADGFIMVSCDGAQNTMTLSKSASMVTASR